MTQRSIDRLLLFSTVLTIVIFAIEISFMNEQLVLTLHYEYMQEMVRRAAYTTSILSWVGTADYIIKNIGAGAYYLADSMFTLGITTQQLTDTVLVEGTFPYKVLCYDKRLQGSITLLESYKKSPKMGCTTQTMTVGASYASIAVMLFLTFVKGANLYAQRYPSRTTIQRVVLYIGLLCPLLVAVGMQMHMTAVQIACMQRTWTDDARRTVEYLGGVFEVATLGMGADGLQLFGPTMELMNDNLITDGRYGLTSITLEKHELVPDIPRIPASVREFLLSDDGEVAEYNAFVKKEKTMVATYSIEASNLLMVLIHVVDNSLMKYTDPPIIAGLVMLLVPLALLFIFNVVVFPYKSLGLVYAVAGEGRWCTDIERLGPGVWRASPRWAWWKTLHFTFLIALMVGGSFVYLERLSQFYGIIDGFRASFVENLETAAELKAIGDVALSNMHLMIVDFVWNAKYVEALQLGSEVEELEVAMFYDQVSVALKSMQYEGMSATTTLQKEDERQYPLLQNTPLGVRVVAMQTNLDDPALSAAATTFACYLIQWDVLYLHDVIRNNVAGLTTGSAPLMAVMETLAPSVQMTADEVEIATTVVLEAASPYVRIAKGYVEARDKGDDPITELWNSALGRRIVEMENAAIDAKNPTDSPFHRLCVIYVWQTFAGTYTIIAAIAVAGLALIFDLFYSGAFYGLSDGVISATRMRRFLPSNDYTSPNRYMAVNHYDLWHAARRAYFLIAAVVIVTSVAIVLCDLEARSATKGVEAVQNSDNILTKGRATDVYDASIVPLSSSSWLRALLSHNKTDSLTATHYTMMWTSTEETIFSSGKPETDSIQIDSRLRKELEVVSMIFATRNYEDSRTVNVYVDYSNVLAMMPLFYDFDSLMTCLDHDTMLYVTEAVFLITENCIHYIDDEATEGIERLKDVIANEPSAAGCGLTEETAVLYFERLIAMRKRAAWFQTRSAIAEEVYVAAFATTEAVTGELNSVMQAFDATHVRMDRSSVPWITILFSWVLSPLVILFYAQVRKMYHALYHV